MSVVLYIVNNLSLMLFAFAVTYSVSDLIHMKIIKTYIVYITNIIFINIILGLAIQQLTLTAILIICIAELIIALTIFNHKKIKFKLPKKSTISEMFEDKIFIALGGILTFSIAALFWYSLFIIPYSYDSTAYHLPNLVDYIQNKKIFITEKLMWSNSYPRHMEMLFMWDLIHFRDGSTLNFHQILCAVIGAFSVFGLLIQNNLKTKFCLLGGILYLSTPIILSQMTTNYIDVALSSFFITALLFMYRFLKDFKKADMVLFSMVLGILLGLKTTALGYVAIFIFSTFVVLIINKTGIKKTITFMSLICMICLFTGSIWYILNIINFRNPIYPFELKCFGTIFFKGLNVQEAIMIPNTPTILQNKNAIVQLLISWSEFNNLQAINAFNFYSDKLFNLLKTFIVDYDETIGGLGFGWIILLVPSSVYFFFKKLKFRNFKLLEVLVFTIPLISFIITPSRWWTRYTTYILIIGIFSFVTLFSREKINKIVKIGAYLLISVFILLNIFQGTYLMYHKYSYIQKVTISVNYKMRSSYVQVSNNPEYRKFYKEINALKSGVSITAFQLKPDSSIYFLQGDNTQNIVKYYPYNLSYNKTVPNLKLPLSNVKSEFREIMKKNNSNYIIASREMSKYIDVSGYKEYIITKENIIYKKQ